MLQVYTRLNHFGVCLSYSAILKLLSEISKRNTAPIQKWIQEGATFKFVGDNVAKLKGVRNITSQNQGHLCHMYSLLVVKNRIPPPPIISLCCQRSLAHIKPESLLPTDTDIARMKLNLTILMCRFICSYIKGLNKFAGLIPKHIYHAHSDFMAEKSEVAVIDILHKNEACHVDMLDIMKAQQSYLGNEFDDRVLSGGDQLTCERQRCAQLHVMDSDTKADQLELLEPVVEDWHAFMIFLEVKCTHIQAS